MCVPKPVAAVDVQSLWFLMQWLCDFLLRLHVLRPVDPFSPLTRGVSNKAFCIDTTATRWAFSLFGTVVG